MAEFNLIVGTREFDVIKEETIVTDCSSTFIYTIYATNLNSINITLTGDHELEKYILNGVTTTFSDSISNIIFNNSLQLVFVLRNSGISGIFNSSNVFIENTTISQNYNDSVIRLNDSPLCSSLVKANEYDALDDTPANKIGSAGKFIQVNTSETLHEYVDIIQDRHYQHDQGLPSASWNILHNLNKFPTVAIVDTSGNLVVGEIFYINTNNITINFSSAFAGKAYLN